MIIKKLQWFSKHEAGDTVSLRVRTVAIFDGVEMLDDGGKDVYGSDAELQAAAQVEGKTTWNEDTICAVYGLVRGVEVKVNG